MSLVFGVGGRHKKSVCRGGFGGLGGGTGGGLQEDCARDFLHPGGRVLLEVGT